MTDQPDSGVAASIDATYAIRQPAEHCGHETILPVSKVSTECVLRPGHSGSHANHEGARWRLAKLADPGAKVSLRKADADLATAQASRNRWRRDYALLVDRHKRMRAELDANQRRAVALVERIDAARAWARQHLEPEQQAGLLAALRSNTTA